MRKNTLQSHSGSIIVTLLVAIGIMTIGIGVTIYMVESSRRQLSNLSRKVDVRSLEFQIQSASSGNACSCLISADLVPDKTTNPTPILTFNSTVTDGSQFLELRRLRTGCTLSSDVFVEEGKPVTNQDPGLVVDKVRLINLKPIATGRWTGDWQVTFAGGQMAPLVVSGQQVAIDSANPTATKIISCGSQGPIKDCPAGWQLIGSSGAANTFCIQTATQTPASVGGAMDACTTSASTQWGPPRLCKPGQWLAACPLVPGMSGNKEWVVMMSANAASSNVMLGGGSCTNISAASSTSNQNYRCCFP